MRAESIDACIKVKKLLNRPLRATIVRFFDHPTVRPFDRSGDRKIGQSNIQFSYLCTMSAQRNIRVIGHRGAKGYAFENSMSSMKCALELGVHMIELDVFRCRSGQLVVFHDEALDDLTDGQGMVESKTLAELNNLRLRNGEPIPTLFDVLRFIDGRIGMNIELKGRQTALLLADMLQTLVATTNWTWDQWIVSSFHWDELRTLKLAIPELKIGLLTDSNPLDALPVARQLEAFSIHPWHQSVDEDVVRGIRDEGFEILTYTVDQPADIQRVIACGVDGIISDYPDRVSSALLPGNT